MEGSPEDPLRRDCECSSTRHPRTTADPPRSKSKDPPLKVCARTAHHKSQRTMITATVRVYPLLVICASSIQVSVHPA